MSQTYKLNALTGKFDLVSSTPPGGASTSVQFNDGGVFNGFGLWNNTTHVLTVYNLLLEPDSGGGIVFHTTNGGPINISADTATVADTDGGGTSIYAGAGLGTANGGLLDLHGGTAGTNGDGGNVRLVPGQGQGGGLDGLIKIARAAGDFSAELDASLLTSTDRHVFFPDKDGTFAYLSDIPTIPTGYQQPTSGIVNGSNKSFDWAAAPNVIVVDQGRTMQQTSSDGTINWTGTTTTVLAQAPNSDIFALA